MAIGKINLIKYESAAYMRKKVERGVKRVAYLSFRISNWGIGVRSNWGIEIFTIDYKLAIIICNCKKDVAFFQFLLKF